MKIFQTLVLSSVLFAGSAHADGFGFNLGPFNLQFNASNGYVEGERSMLDTPICNAITNQKRLEITVQGTEKVSSKEQKKIIKNLIIEPYAFGVTTDGKPVLRGNVVEEKLVKEVSIKYGDDEFDEPTAASKKKEKGFFSGMFSSDKNRVLDVRKIVEIKVLPGSHFDVPKNYKSLKDDHVQVICELPTVQQLPTAQSKSVR